MLCAAFVFSEEHMTTVCCVTVDIYCGGSGRLREILLISNGIVEERVLKKRGTC